MTDAGLVWTDIPTHLLHAELRRRQGDERPTCGTKGTKGQYNTLLHGLALLLILTLSTVACSFPIVVKRFPRVPVPHRFLFLSRHFGTGVLIATAFVHLLPTAFESLTDPCLPPFWIEGYSAMPGLVSMTAVLVVVGIEMFFASKGAGHTHDYDTFGMEEHETYARPARNSLRTFKVNEQPPVIALPDRRISTESPVADRFPSADAVSPRLPTTPHDNGVRKYDLGDDDDDSDLDIDPQELAPRGASDPKAGSSLLPRSSADHHAHRHSLTGAEQAVEMTDTQNKKQLLQCLLLEAGILFHSVFIGLALSVATGTSFIVLLVAISFHQTFEGFALGSRISAVRFSKGSLKPWLMALAYGTTTPIGQAIGLSVHNLYDPASQTGLLMVGSMNAISSGLLLFAGLVELLAEDFLSDESYRTLTGKRRLQACASVVCGAALMALVGAWA